jgi:hypothetical protein
VPPDVAQTAAHGSCGHDPKFFAQVEKLLQKGAPISVGDPEAGAVHILRDIVPARFPLVKRKMELAETRRRNSIERSIKDNKPHVEVISDESIITEFEDRASELTWRQALHFIGLKSGRVDESGRPLNPRYRRLVAQARRVHSRARRQYLDEERGWKHICETGTMPVKWVRWAKRLRETHAIPVSLGKMGREQKKCRLAG